MKNCILIFFVATIVSCHQYDLNNPERQIYKTYNVGDTLLFTSIKTGNIQSFLVVSKDDEIYPNGFGNHSRHREACIFYRNLAFPLSHYLDDGPVPIYPKIVDVQINKNSIFLVTVPFQGFIGTNNNFDVLHTTDTINSLGKKIINYYILTKKIATDTSNSIDTIIWQQRYGIVKYDLSNGDSYTRTNIPTLVN